MLVLDLVNPIAIAGVVLVAGYGRVVPVLVRLNIPAPVVGAFFIDFINAVIITICLNPWA